MKFSHTYNTQVHIPKLYVTEIEKPSVLTDTSDTNRKNTWFLVLLILEGMEVPQNFPTCLESFLFGRPS